MPLSKDAKQAEQTITLQNNYNQSVTVDTELKGIDSNAGLLVPTDDLDKRLAQNVKLSVSSFVIQPYASQSIKVTVTNTDTLGPGGHYGMLIFTQRFSGSSQLALRAAASVSLFAVKADGEKQALRAAIKSTNGWLFKLPTTMNVEFANAGNIHVIPRASADMYGASGLLYAHGIANIESYTLFPDEKMISHVEFTSLASTWKPQRVTLQLTYRASGSDSTQSVTKIIWYVPPTVLLLFPLLYILFRAYRFFRKRYRSKSRGRVQKTSQAEVLPVDSLVKNTDPIVIDPAVQSEHVAQPAVHVRHQPVKPITQHESFPALKQQSSIAPIETEIGPEIKKIAVTFVEPTDAKNLDEVVNKPTKKLKPAKTPAAKKTTKKAAITKPKTKAKKAVKPRAKTTKKTEIK